MSHGQPLTERRSIKYALTVVPGPDGAPWAVLTEEGKNIPAPIEAIARRLLPHDSLFCAELSHRWDRMVVCSESFKKHYRAGALDGTEPGFVNYAPNGFVLEVLT